MERYARQPKVNHKDFPEYKQFYNIQAIVL